MNYASISQELGGKAIRINGEKVEKTFSRKVDADAWYAEMKRSSGF